MLQNEGKYVLPNNRLNVDLSVLTSSFVVWGCPDLPPLLPHPQRSHHALPVWHASSPSPEPRGSEGMITI